MRNNKRFVLLNGLRIIIIELCCFVLCAYFVYRMGIDDKKCVEAISTYTLPKSELLDQCEQLNEFEANIHSYRRLLPAYYADGLSKVKSDLPCFRDPHNICDFISYFFFSFVFL